MRCILLAAVLVAVAAPASAETVIWTGEVHVEKWVTGAERRGSPGILPTDRGLAWLVDGQRAQPTSRSGARGRITRLAAGIPLGARRSASGGRIWPRRWRGDQPSESGEQSAAGGCQTMVAQTPRIAAVAQLKSGLQDSLHPDDPPAAWVIVLQVPRPAEQVSQTGLVQRFGEATIRAHPSRLDVEASNERSHHREIFLVLRCDAGHQHRAATVRTRRRRRGSMGPVDSGRSPATRLPAAVGARAPTAAPGPVLGEGSCLSESRSPRRVELLLEAVSVALPLVPVALDSRQLLAQPFDRWWGCKARANLPDPPLPYKHPEPGLLPSAGVTRIPR